MLDTFQRSSSESFKASVLRDEELWKGLEKAQATACHTNVVSIFDVGEEKGIHYIIMEYVMERI